MKKLFVRLSVCFLVFVSLSSSVPVNNDVTNKGGFLKSESINKAALDVVNLANENAASYKNLKKVATELKGSKLTFKERVALKVFGKKLNQKSGGEGKSQLIALILCLVIGNLGIHRFYLGYTWQGIVQILTLGGCGIWSLIDLVRIIIGDLKPKDGEYAKKL